MKICLKCKKRKARERAKKWRADNPEKAKVSVKKWRINNTDKVIGQRRNWYIKNAEKVKDHIKNARSKDPEKARVLARNAYAENPDKFREYSRNTRDKDPEKAKERVRKWRVNNIDEVKERDINYSRIYRKLHPDKGVEANQRRRALKKLAFIENVNPLVLAERDNWICGICSQSVSETDKSIDHIIPLTKGGKHSYVNTQLAHLLCNIKKGNRLQEVA